MKCSGSSAGRARFWGRSLLLAGLSFGLCLFGASCTKSPVLPKKPEPASAAPVDDCGHVRMGAMIYYGTLEPTLLPLTPGQKQAIGDFEGCTGILINQRWVLTAAHCNIRTWNKFCIGEEASSPDTCLEIEEVVNHYRVDLALLKLKVPVDEVNPEVSPVPLFRAGFDSGWIGRKVEVAGYGTMENGHDGTRKFAVERIVELGRSMVTVFADGERGVCFGDSGGPLLVLGEDGRVRVGGVLSHGDSSCVGYDSFIRVALFKEWVESIAGPTVVEGTPCDTLDSVGRCFDNIAVWCEAGSVSTELCGGETRCGWSGPGGGFRCIRGDDSCGGVDGYGECVGDVAYWCEAGARRSRDCGACAQKCGAVSTEVGVYCMDDPCEGIDSLGRCEGDVVKWCDRGVLEVVDCSDEGLVCGWYDDDYGYYCVEG